MKTYKLKKELPFCEVGKVFTTSLGRRKRKDGGLVGKSREDILEGVIGTNEESERLEEITKPSYIVTEEGEIIGEYKGECFWLDQGNCIHETDRVKNSYRTFITKEQAEAYVKREKARRELRRLYYENGYEENKGAYEVYYHNVLYSLECYEGTSSYFIPHCGRGFHKKMLKLPRVQELYKIIFGIDE